MYEFVEYHVPVLRNETLHYLGVRPGGRYIDATADGGGHSVAILRAIQPGGSLLAIEWDEEFFGLLGERLRRACSGSSNNYVLRQASYTELARIARSLRFGPVAGVLFDFGMSSFHTGASKRGFSFRGDEPLDMRFSRSLRESAADILARRTPKELEAMLRDFGQERFAGRIAREIAAARQDRPIRRTPELVAAIRHAVPPRYRRGRLHFATRTFQALRIAVNHELENIPAGLAAAADILAPGGRIVTIAFHSLEDGAVKRFFRGESLRRTFRPLLATPLRPSREELGRNPPSRSARLRVFEKLP